MSRNDKEPCLAVLRSPSTQAEEGRVQRKLQEAITPCSFASIRLAHNWSGIGCSVNTVLDKLLKRPCRCRCRQAQAEVIWIWQMAAALHDCQHTVSTM